MGPLTELGPLHLQNMLEAVGRGRGGPRSRSPSSLPLSPSVSSSQRDWGATGLHERVHAYDSMGVRVHMCVCFLWCYTCVRVRGRSEKASGASATSHFLLDLEAVMSSLSPPDSSCQQHYI